MAPEMAMALPPDHDGGEARDDAPAVGGEVAHAGSGLVADEDGG